MRNVKYLSLFAFLLMASKCATPQKPDQGMSALEGGDYTALIEGCGHQLVPGYTYCRFVEGEVKNSDVVYFVGPSVECSRDDACVFIQVFFPTGGIPSFAGKIPKGETRLAVEWKELLQRSFVTKGDRGFWPFIYTIYWTDVDGNEQITKTLGEIRVRVISSEYTPLHMSEHDPNFIWEWTENNQLKVKMTGGGRTYVEPLNF